MTVTITFRTTGTWGAGIGANLTASQVDTNFYNCKTAIEALQSSPPTAISIDEITQSGDTLTVHYTDASTDGPFTLPSIPIVFRGTWAISTAYAVGDVITQGGSTYLVIYAHTSDPSSFDPGANDGLGHNYYGLLLENPASALPTGGSVGQVLTKTTATDYDAAWLSPSSLKGIKSVTGTTLTLAAADAGKWHRFTNASGCIVTVPANADVSIPVGSVYEMKQLGAGGLTVIEGDTGVLINGLSVFEMATDTIGATIELIKVATNEWDLCGYLLAST